MNDLPTWLLNLPVADRKAVLVLDPKVGRRETLGSAIRGAIGHRTLDALCARPHRICKGCDLQAHCPHAMLYSPISAGDGDATPPWRLLLDDRGPLVTVTFRTFGDHADELGDVLVRAFSEQVVGGNLEGAGVESYAQGQWSPARPLMDWLPPARVTPHDTLVVLESPLELKVNGEVSLEPPSLRTLVAAIGRRAATLVQAWSKPLFETERAVPHRLLETADEVELEPIAIRPYDAPRRSNRQEQMMAFQGLLGALRYEFVDPELLSWLEVGRVIGVGRHTPFGFGAVSVWDASAEGDL
jgi:hypothetical protein